MLRAFDSTNFRPVYGGKEEAPERHFLIRKFCNKQIILDNTNNLQILDDKKNINIISNLLFLIYLLSFTQTNFDKLTHVLLARRLSKVLRTEP